MREKPGFRNILKNAGLILSGNTVASLFGLVSTMLLAQHLGPEKYGVLALMQTFVATVRSFFSAQTWQAIVRHGVSVFDNKDQSEFFGVAKVALFIEIGIVLAAGVSALLGAIFLPKLWGLPSEYVTLGGLYCATIFANFTDYFTGMFRLFNKFQQISYYTISTAIVRLGVVVVIWWFKLPFVTSVVLLIAHETMKNFAFVALGARLFRRETNSSLTDLFRAKRTTKITLSGVATYLSPIWAWSTLRMLPNELDLFIIGALTGTANAGTYKIVKQFTSVVTRIYGSLYQAAFPDINRLRQEGAHGALKGLLRRAALTIVGVSGLAMLSFLALGKFLLSATVGEQYEAAYWPTVVYLAALAISSPAIIFMSFLFSTGGERYVMFSYLGCVAIYFCLVSKFIHSYGLLGASWAYFVFSVCVTSLLVRRSARILSRPPYSVAASAA